jgi:hypothetical protein
VVVESAVDGRNNLGLWPLQQRRRALGSPLRRTGNQFTQFNFYADHELTDDFCLHFEGGRAKSEFENPIQTTITIDKLNAQNYVYDYRGNDRCR